MSDQIFVSGLALHAYHGVMPNEAKVGQTFKLDLVLDIVGGPYVSRNLSVLAMDGRLVQIGLMGGDSTSSVDFRRVLGRRLTITGSTLRPRKNRSNENHPRRAALVRSPARRS